jgi:hypothetical protein
MRNFYLTLISIILITSVGCNSKPEKSESTIVENDKKVDKLESIKPQESIKSSKSKLPMSIQSNLEINEIMLFEDIEWNKPKNDNLLIFKGINNALMSYVLIDYVHEKHLNPNKVEEEPKDSITLNLSEQTFTYYRISFSDITEYDIKRHSINTTHRLHWSEADEMTEEEVKEWEDEHQRMLDNVDSNLINIKKSERFIVMGSWHYVDLRNDSLFITISGSSHNVDAIHYARYGEDGPIGHDKIYDKVNLDLYKKIHELGQYKKFIESDLKIIDPQDLTYIRNQFYARKGYKFKTEKMQNFFLPKSWYDGIHDDVTDQLTETELYNIYFIKDLED